MESILTVILVSAFLSALMPEGNAKSGMKMMTGLVVFFDDFGISGAYIFEF